MRKPDKRRSEGEERKRRVSRLDYVFMIVPQPTV